MKLEEIEKLCGEMDPDLQFWGSVGKIQVKDTMQKLLSITKAAKTVCFITERERWEAIEELKKLFEELEKE